MEKDVFIGEFSHTVDPKGRLAVPYRFRRALGKGAVITRGTDHNLVIYPPQTWRALAQKLASLPMSNPSAVTFARFMFSGALEVNFDRQGRVLIPAYLRDWAKIKDKAVVVGLYNKIELWQSSFWANQQKQISQNQDKILSQLADLGV